MGQAPEIGKCGETSRRLHLQTNVVDPRIQVIDIAAHYIGEVGRIALIRDQRRLGVVTGQRQNSLFVKIDASIEVVPPGEFGLEPAVMLGHSSGEYSTMLASGILEGISEDLVIETSRVIESMEKSGKIPEAVMIAAGTDRSLVEKILEEEDIGPLFIAMDNCPHQVVLVGTEGPAEKMVAALKERRVLCEPLSFRRGYHTPLFDPVSERLREVFRKFPISKPRVPVWSCTLKGPYPEDLEEVRALLANHWTEPVAFR